MPIICVRDNENSKWKRNAKKQQKKQTKIEKSKGNRSYSEKVRALWFCCLVKLGFLQLICKASLFFNSNSELALLIVLKQRELYESKHAALECRFLKIWDLLSFLICSSILVFKSTSLANIARTTRKDLKSSAIGSLYEK